MERLQWRRNKVLELSSQGHSQSEITRTLHTSQSTLNRDNKTVLQALALINDCYKYIMDLATNGVVITDAIKFIQTNKGKLTMSSMEEDNGKESKEPNYDDDKDQLEKKQEEETGELKQETTNQVF